MRNLGIFAAAFFVACSTSTVSVDDEDGSSSSVKSVLESSGSGKSSAAQSSSGAVSSSSNENSSSSAEAGCVGETGKAWDGTTAKSFACGSGTKSSPYIIQNAEQLAYLAFVTNASDSKFAGKYFKLDADILLSGETLIDESGTLLADSANLVKWTPIGNSSVAFSGNFDGDGHAVSGVFINTTSTHNGLFGNSEGTVQNVTVKNSWIQGGDYTAGVVGYNEGTIENSANEAAVVGRNYVGGITGIANSSCSIQNSRNSGLIQGSENVGGIVGHAYYCKLTSCQNNSDVTCTRYCGGIIGKAGYWFVSSYSINASNLENHENIFGKSSFVGGIIGSCAASSGSSCSTYYTCGSITNSKNDGSVNGASYTAGLIGLACKATATNLANTGAVSGTDFSAGIFGYSGYSTSENLYNRGEIVGGKYVGGIIGHNQEGVTSSAYSTAAVEGDSLVGILVGYNYNTTMKDYYYIAREGLEAFGQNNGGGSATAKTESAMKSADFAKLLGDAWIFDSAQNNGFPIFKE